MDFRLVRRTPDLTDAEVAHMAAAIGLQLTRDVCPVWNIDPARVSVAALGPGELLPPDAVPVELLDQSSPADLGYHSFGPGAQVFVKGILANGGKPLTGLYAVSVVTSHEVLEALIDPRSDCWDPAGFAFEICDPVQADWYEIDGVSVSNFVGPEWFDAEVTQGKPMDHLGHVSASHRLAPGGYAMKLVNGAAQEVWGTVKPPTWRLAVRTRNRRRLTGVSP